MSTGLRLGEYAVTPLYNIKAVVQATGISPSTLRAWERRYNIARPQRSDSGYRLYAERDVAVIRWLKAQVDAGMSISQAVSWLGNLVSDAGDLEDAILPTTGHAAPLHDTTGNIHSGTQREQVRDFATLRHELLTALTNFDETDAERVISEAFAIYPIEQVGDQLFLPILLEIGDLCTQGRLSRTTEQFAGCYLIQRLGTLLRFIPNGSDGPLIWVGCARTELHEASALLLTVYLRRAGYQVHYLGQNLPTEEHAAKDLVNEAKRLQPAMILFSASTQHAAEKLGQLSSRLTQSGHLPAIIAYSGPIYARTPELRATTAGVFLGTTATEVLHNIDELLAAQLHPNRHSDKNHAKKPDKSTPIKQNVADRIGTGNR